MDAAGEVGSLQGVQGQGEARSSFTAQDRFNLDAMLVPEDIEFSRGVHRAMEEAVGRRGEIHDTERGVDDVDAEVVVPMRIVFVKNRQVEPGLVPFRIGDEGLVHSQESALEAEIPLDRVLPACGLNGKLRDLQSDAAEGEGKSVFPIEADLSVCGAPQRHAPFVEQGIEQAKGPLVHLHHGGMGTPEPGHENFVIFHELLDRAGKPGTPPQIETEIPHGIGGGRGILPLQEGQPLAGRQVHLRPPIERAGDGREINVQRGSGPAGQDLGRHAIHLEGEPGALPTRPGLRVQADPSQGAGEDNLLRGEGSPIRPVPLNGSRPRGVEVPGPGVVHEGDRPHGHGVPAVVLQGMPSREVSGKGSLPGDQDVRPGAGGDSGIHRQALQAPGLGVPDRFGFESHVKCRGSAFEHDLHRAGPHRIDVESGEQEAGLQLALHMGTGPTGSRPHRLGAAAPPFQKVVSNQCQVHVPVSGAVEGRRGIRKPARGQGLLDGAGPIPEVQGPLDVALDEIPVQRRGKDVRIAPAAKGKPPHGERGSILSGRSETGLRDPTGIQQVNVGPPRGQAGLLIQGELAGARQVSEQGQLRIEHEGRTAA